MDVCIWCHDLFRPPPDADPLSLCSLRQDCSVFEMEEKILEVVSEPPRLSRVSAFWPNAFPRKTILAERINQTRPVGSWQKAKLTDSPGISQCCFIWFFFFDDCPRPVLAFFCSLCSLLGLRLHSSSRVTQSVHKVTQPVVGMEEGAKRLRFRRELTGRLLWSRTRRRRVEEKINPS